MNRRSILIRSVFVLLIVLAITGIPGVNAYVFESVIQDNGDSSNTVMPPSFFYSGGCSVNSTLYATITSTSFPYTAYSYWYSPASTNILYSAASPASNVSCKNMGTGYTLSSANSFYEGKSTTTSSGTATTWLKNYYTCLPDANEMIIYDNIQRRTDSYGNYPFSYGKMFAETCTLFTADSTAHPNIPMILDWIDKGYNTDCGANLNVSARHLGSNCGGAGTYYFSYGHGEAIPFNSGASGSVNFTLKNVTFYNISAGTCNINVYNAQIWVWDTVLNTTTFQGISQNESVGITVNMNLIPNRDYWILLNATWGGNHPTGGTCAVGYNYTSYNMSIWAYTPSLSCTNWSECIANSQQRTCTDLNGKITPYVETDTCGTAAVAYLNNLGFEESYDQLTQVCKPWTLCLSALFNITVKYPKNWSVILNDLDNNSVARVNFITMTSEGGSREGSLALRMNYIPPKDWEPVWAAGDITECGNRTYGISPAVRTGYNSSLFINLSFPSPYMDLRYSVKKCAMPPLQYDITPNNVCELFIPGKRYYTGGNGNYYTTNTTTFGRYQIRLFDASTGTNIVNIEQHATEEWADFQTDLSNSGILTGHNYTLSLSAVGENQQDPYSSCVYFDKIEATVLSGTSRCISYCDTNLTRYEVISTDPCIKRIAPSSVCVPDSTDSSGLQDVIEGKKSYECIGTSAWYYNNLTGQLIETPNAPLCVSESGAATTTPTTYTEYLNTTLYSVPWMTSLLILILMVALPVLLAMHGSGAGEMWPLPLFGIAQFIFVCSLNGILPLYFAVMIGVIAAAILAVFISKTVRGG